MSACAGDTEIIGSLDVQGDRVDLTGIEGAMTSIGLIDDWVLITTVAPVTPPPGWSPYQDHTLEVSVQWVSPTGELGSTTSLGWSTWSTIAPRWARLDDHLVGAVWAVAGPSAPPLPSTHGITMWSFAAGGTSECHDTPALPVYGDPDNDTISWSGQAWENDPMPLAPIGVAHGRVVALASGQHRYMCISGRLITATLDGCSATADVPLSTTCTPPAGDPGVLWPDAVSLGEDLGVLFRPAFTIDDRVRWLVLSQGATLSAGPVAVGGDYSFNTVANGLQPRGAAIADRVGFFEVTNSEGTCFSLRTMALDGSSSEAAPWQLGCNRGGQLTTNVDLLPLPGAAVAIADEVDADGSARLTARVVTSAGRRGSEALVLTTEAGATGTPGFRAAADGDHVVVVYSDADGLWLQRFAFTRQ